MPISRRCRPSGTSDEGNPLIESPAPPLTNFTCVPAPDNPGWLHWAISDQTRFNGAVLGDLLVRIESDTSARVRMFPQHRHTNSVGQVHGGVTLALVDVAMFSALYVLRGIDAGRSVTIDVQAQFISAGEINRPLDAIVELLRETGRMAFMRGLVVQEDVLTASFSGTVRKPSGRV